MCGIVGYIGKKEKNLKELLLKGLKLLEYRGYDSSGLAVLNESKISLYKKRGKIIELEHTLQSIRLYSHAGIGHTRWATHGEPNDTNSHPHLDCKGKIAVVHNGIIENYLELRKELKEKGHEIRSDTDSEIIAHLIEEEIENGGKDLQHAFLDALKKVVGTYALAIINTLDRNNLYVARNGSPLIIGVEQSNYYIASDIPALLPFTKEVIILEDYQAAVIGKDGIRIYDLKEGRLISPITHRVNWKSDEIDKSGFPHYMLKEIFEQPLRARKIFSQYVNDNKVVFPDLKFDQKFFQKINKIYIQACGTSFHAGLVAKYLFEQYLSIPVEVDISSEFRYRKNFFEQRSLLITISQSGETADSLAGLRLAKAHKVPTLAICNVIGSSIARESDSVIYIQAGPEIGVASTKAYTAQIITLYLLMLYIANLRNCLPDYKIDIMLKELRKIPAMIELALLNEAKAQEVANKFSFAAGFLFLGRGINYPTALESALKLKEIAYIHSTGYAAGEMKHGPIALIDENLPVVSIAVKARLYEKIYSNIQEILARRGRLITVITEGDKKLASLSQYYFEIPDCPEDISPILTIIPLQLLAYYIGLNRGCNVDQPRNLAKSVTVE